MNFLPPLVHMSNPNMCTWRTITAGEASLCFERFLRPGAMHSFKRSFCCVCIFPFTLLKYSSVNTAVRTRARLRTSKHAGTRERRHEAAQRVESAASPRICRNVGVHGRRVSCRLVMSARCDAMAHCMRQMTLGAPDTTSSRMPWRVIPRDRSQIGG